MSTLLTIVAVSALAGYLLALTLYGSLPRLPASAPVPIVLLALAEVAVAKAIRDRVHRRKPSGPGARGRVLHPFQVARAAALAKATSLAAALMTGLYAGVLAWTAPRADSLVAARDDAIVAALTMLSALLLTAAALALERACRIPSEPDEGLATA